ncbi:MAG: PLDc N-terminal domain-containing protein [Gemmatimonadaceae bacterium]
MLELANTHWIGLTLILIDLVALATIWLSKRHSTSAKLVWTAMVVVLPVLGALAWVALGRERTRS